MTAFAIRSEGIKVKEDEQDGLDSVRGVKRGRSGRGLARGDRRDSTARIVVAGIIVLIWAIAYLKAVIDPTFSPPPGLSAPMLAAVAYLFGTGLSKAKDKEE